jgi:anti-sigma-K factor RskA
MEMQGHVFELLPAYALGSLDEDEKRIVKDHLGVCEICRAELGIYSKVVDDLPLAMIESAPPPELKTKITNQIKNDRSLAQEGPKRPWWQRFSQTFTPAWGLVGLALILVLVISNLFLWQRVRSLENTTQTALTTVVLQGTEITPQAIGMLVISQDGEYGTLVVDALPVLDKNLQYQLWLIQDGQRTSGGVFSVNSEGYGFLRVSSPNPLSNYSAFGITIEPEGGSPGPTGEKVLGGQF